MVYTRLFETKKERKIDMILSDLTQHYRIFYEDLREHLPTYKHLKAQYQELRGTSGTRLYVWGEGVLAISCESGKKFRQLLTEVPDAWQETPCVVCFPAEHIATAAEAIHARKKRQVTEADRERGRKLAERFSFGRK